MENGGPSNTEIGTVIAHVTRDADSNFKVKRFKATVPGLG